MESVFLYSGLYLAFLMIFPLYRALRGPTVVDRMLGVNAIGSATAPGIRSGMNKANVDALVLLSVATRPD